MKLSLLLLTGLLMFVVPAIGQDAATPAEKEAAYTRTITTRAQKITAKLGITDSVKANRVTAIIAGQYRNLNNIHALTNEELKNSELEKLHLSYLSQLSAELTPAQVEQVKDGMTYGVLPLTYNGYLEMIPRLTDEQKKQIMTWLVEAREHAMDAESSEKKHWWFGKYKGRINNYLSAAGYDLKKEGDEWQKRIKAAKN
jgi:Protein of unknown function (DUF3826)